MGIPVDSFPGALAYAKLSPVRADAGYVMPAYEQDGGGLGVSTRRTPLVSSHRRLAVGLATKLLDYQFNSTTHNTNILKCLFTTMTATQAVGALLLNANSTATTTTGVGLQTWRYINFPGNGVVQVEIEALFTAAPLANQLFIGGVFPLVSATAQPTDGAYFKYSSAGLVGAINFNGTETAAAPFSWTPSYGTSYTLRMDIADSGVDFWADDTLLGTIMTPAANGTPMAFGALPVSMQFLNPGAVAGGTQMQVKICNLSVTQRDLATEKTWEDQQASSGLGASQGSEGQAIGSTALYTNSLAAGAGVAMTNTTAALGVGLGGQFATQPTLAAGTDGILCSFLNPVGTVNIIPRTLFIRGVRIQTVVTTALAGGPVVYAYALAYGHTALSLATAESASFANNTTKAPRRIPLGIESIAATAAVGTVGSANGIYMPFAVPIVVNPGEYVAVSAKNLGTVTSAGVVVALVTFNAFWE